MGLSSPCADFLKRDPNRVAKDKLLLPDRPTGTRVTLSGPRLEIGSSQGRSPAAVAVDNPSELSSIVGGGSVLVHFGARNYSDWFWQLDRNRSLCHCSAWRRYWYTSFAERSLFEAALAVQVPRPAGHHHMVSMVLATGSP